METDNNTVIDLAKLNVLERLAALEETMRSQDPQIPVHLQNIHKTLLQYEELVHMLDDNQIRILMEAMKKYRNVELVRETIGAKQKKALGKTTVDDI